MAFIGHGQSGSGLMVTWAVPTRQWNMLGHHCATCNMAPTESYANLLFQPCCRSFLRGLI